MKEVKEAMAAIAAAPDDPRDPPTREELAKEMAELFHMTLGDVRRERGGT